MAGVQLVVDWRCGRAAAAAAAAGLAAAPRQLRAIALEEKSVGVLLEAVQKALSWMRIALAVFSLRHDGLRRWLLIKELDVREALVEDLQVLRQFFPVFGVISAVQTFMRLRLSASFFHSGSKFWHTLPLCASHLALVNRIRLTSGAPAMSLMTFSEVALSTAPEAWRGATAASKNKDSHVDMLVTIASRAYGRLS